MRFTTRNVRNLAGILTSLPAPANSKDLANNLRSVRADKPWLGHVGDSRSRIQAGAEAALSWIGRSQDSVGSGGIGCYRFQGWTPGYPEVTGYIIPTFFDFADLLGREDLVERAIRMADWELGIQRPGGGFESWYEGEGRPPVVFNTGQVLRGLVRAGSETGEEKYMAAADRAARWIASVQGGDGSFSAGNYLGMKRVYDVYATAGVAQLASMTGDRELADVASQMPGSRSRTRPRMDGSIDATTPLTATTPPAPTPSATRRRG